MILLVVIGSLIMVGLAVAASWAMVGLAVFAAWFLVVSAGLILKLIAVVLIAATWRKVRRLPRSRSIDR